MNEQTSQQDKDLLQEISKGVEPHGIKTQYHQTPPFSFSSGSPVMGVFQQTSRIIPPPEEFERYPQKVQDAFLECLNEQRIRANKEQEHRHVCEKTKIENEQKNAEASWEMGHLTAFLGFSVILFALCGSAFCAYLGKESTAITLGSTAIIAICGAMVKLIWGNNQRT